MAATKPSPEARCAYCGGSQDEVGPLSYRHICRSCGIERVIEANRQLEAKRGPVHERRVAGALRAATREATAA